MVGRSNRRGWGWIRRLPSKRWQGSYIGPDQVRHNAPHTFSAKMDAEAWLSAERRLIELDQWQPPAYRKTARQAQVVTVGSYAASWIEHRSVKPRTRSHYEGLLARHIEPRLGGVPLGTLSPAAVRAWHASMDPSYPVIRSHAYSLLHSIMSTAVDDGLIARNPCAIPKAMKATRRREPVILKTAEVSALANAICPQYRALILIAAWCGLRWGEVSELRCKDIGEGCEVITVSRAVVHRSRQCLVSSPKSGRGRAVVVPPHVRGDLARHLDTYIAPGPDALLFAPARGGCHVRDRVFAEHFAAALDTIGREGVRFHDLRHFCGTMTARVGSLAENMARLGHSTVAASLIYQGIVSGRDAQIAEALSELAKQETQPPI